MIIRRVHWYILAMFSVLGLVGGAAVGGLFTCGTSGSGYSSAPAPSSAPAQTSDEAPAELTSADSPYRSNYRFELPSAEKIQMDELAPERPVAIVVMKGTWCSVCRRQLDALSDRLHMATQMGAAIVGLSTGSADTNRHMMRKLNLEFPVLSTTSDQFLRDVRLSRDRSERAIPGVVFLNEQGNIAKVHRGRYPGKPQEKYILRTLQKLSH